MKIKHYALLLSFTITYAIVIPAASITATKKFTPKEPKLMINLGAACYANAGLQCLFATEAFNKWIMDTKINQPLLNLCNDSIKAYQDYFKLQTEFNKIKSLLDQTTNIRNLTITRRNLETSIRQLTRNTPPNQKEIQQKNEALNDVQKAIDLEYQSGYQKNEKYKKIYDSYKKALNNYNIISQKLKHADTTNKQQLQIAALHNIQKQYTDIRQPEIITNAVAASIGNLSQQEDVLDETLKILDNISLYDQTLPTYFTLMNIKVNAISPERYPDLLNDTIISVVDNDTSKQIQAVADLTKSLPNILILAREADKFVNRTIQRTTNQYSLAGSVWRVDSGFGNAGHYFAIVKYNDTWYRLDEPENYNNQYSIENLPPLQSMALSEHQVEKIFKGGILQQSDFNIPTSEIYSNAYVTCRMLVYEKQSSTQNIEQPLTQLHANLTELTNKIKK